MVGTSKKYNKKRIVSLRYIVSCYLYWEGGTTEDAEKISFIMESKIYTLFVVTSFVRKHITIRLHVLNEVENRRKKNIP